MVDEIDAAERDAFDRALVMVATAMDASGLRFERSPTLYANLITMTLAQLFQNLPQAQKALELLFTDLRTMLPLHHAQVQEAKKTATREALMRRH